MSYYFAMIEDKIEATALSRMKFVFMNLGLPFNGMVIQVQEAPRSQYHQEIMYNSMYDSRSESSNNGKIADLIRNSR